MCIVTVLVQRPVIVTLHDGEQTGSSESCDHGSTEISGCHSSSIEIDDHRGDTVINGCHSPCQGSTVIVDNSEIESDVHENNTCVMLVIAKNIHSPVLLYKSQKCLRKGCLLQNSLCTQLC